MVEEENMYACACRGMDGAPVISIFHSMHDVDYILKFLRQVQLRFKLHTRLLCLVEDLNNSGCYFKLKQNDAGLQLYKRI